MKSQRETIQKGNLVRVLKVKCLILEGGKRKRQGTPLSWQFWPGQIGGKNYLLARHSHQPWAGRDQGYIQKSVFDQDNDNEWLRFVNTKINWRRWNCLSWTREIKGRHSISFQYLMTYTRWDTFIFITTKITSTLKIIRKQTSAHKFSMQFTPCTKALANGWVCNPASIVTQRAMWPLAQSAQKRRYLLVSRKRYLCLICPKAQSLWTHYNNVYQHCPAHTDSTTGAQVKTVWSSKGSSTPLHSAT